jgi:hypothetical protein
MAVNINYIKPSNLICDKFSMTAKLHESHMEILRSRIEELVDVGYAIYTRKGKYLRAVNLSFDHADFSPVLVQIDPKIPGLNDIRIEFNPARHALGYLLKVFNALLPGQAYAFIETGICTRFDVTVDLPGVSINQILYHADKFTKSTTYGKSGAFETIYIGSKDSTSRLFCIYDKRAEIMRKNKKYGFQEKESAKEVTRIEARVLKRVPLLALEGISNAFAGLKLWKYPKGPYTNLLAFFLDSCRYRTAQQALLLATESNRKKFKAFLNQSRCEWWDIDHIWEQYPKALRHVIPFEKVEPSAPLPPLPPVTCTSMLQEN